MSLDRHKLWIGDTANGVRRFFISLPVLSVVLVFSTNAFAKSEVRLDAPGYAMEHMDIPDQGKNGDCFAQTATQMINAYRISHGAPVDEVVSVMHVKYSAGGSLDSDSGWMAPVTILSAKAIGKVCTQREINRIVGARGEESFLNQVSLAFDYGYKYWETNRTGPPPIVEEFTHNLIKFFHTSPEKTETIRAALLKSFIPYRSTPKASGDYLAREILPALCADDLADISGLPKPDMENQFLRNNEKISKSSKEKIKYVSTKISALLDLANPQPVEVGICANFLRDNPKYQMNASKDPCYSHSALIIGKRMNKKGELEFLLRNSWGPKWCPSSAQFECDGGQAWIPASVLGVNTNGFSVMPE